MLMLDGLEGANGSQDVAGLGLFSASRREADFRFG
jgi:hypothetical protein